MCCWVISPFLFLHFVNICINYTKRSYRCNMNLTKGSRSTLTYCMTSQCSTTAKTEDLINMPSNKFANFRQAVSVLSGIYLQVLSSQQVGKTIHAQCTNNNVIIRPPHGSGEGLKFYPWTFIYSFFTINPPCSAATHWMTIKCILDIRP